MSKYKYGYYSAYNGEILTKEAISNRKRLVSILVQTAKINPHFIGAISIENVVLYNYELVKYFGRTLEQVSKKAWLELLKGQVETHKEVMEELKNVR